MTRNGRNGRNGPSDGPGGSRVGRASNILQSVRRAKKDIYRTPAHGPRGENLSGATRATEQNGASETNEFAVNMERFTRSLARTKSKATVESYERYLNLMAQALDGMDPANWTPKDCEAFLETPQWVDGWKSNQTKACARSAAKYYWKLMGRDELLGSANFDFWEARRKDKAVDAKEKMMKGVPSWGEVETVLAEVKDIILTSDDPGEVYRTFALHLIAEYGLRCIGAANLRVCDVKVKDKVLHVYRSKGNKSRDVMLGEDTPALFERFMSARSAIVEGLRDLHGGNRQVLTKLTSLDRADAPLFFVRGGDGTGDKIVSKALGRMVRDVSDRILGRHVRPHGYRHAKATHLVQDLGMPLHLAAVYLGHEDISMTMKYTHTTVKDQVEFFKNGNGTSVPVAPVPSPSPVAAGDVAGKMRVLAELNRDGVLTDTAFAAAVAALS